MQPPNRTFLTQAGLASLLRSLGWVLAYASWILLFRLLVLTFITYFLVSSSRGPRFEDINELFSANELPLMGLCAALFVGLLRAFYPITSTTTGEVISLSRLRRRFLPGFAHGSLLAVGTTLAFVLSGSYRYLGFFMHFQDTALAVLTILVRIVALGAFAYFEEYLFRQKIGLGIARDLWGGRKPSLSGGLAACVGPSIVYCAIKLIQFDLGVMHLITLFLVSVALSVRAWTSGDFGYGAGFWAALLIVFQPLLSLPALGNDFTGLLLVRYQPGLEGTDALIRFITGGAGGPLSSFALQTLLLSDIARELFNYKKTLSNAVSEPLRS